MYVYFIEIITDNALKYNIEMIIILLIIILV